MRKLAQISSQLPICQQTVNNDRARSLERFLQQPQTKGAEDRPGALLVSQAGNIPLFQPIHNVQVGEDSKIVIRIGFSIGTEANAPHGNNPGWIGGRESLYLLDF